MARHLVVAGTLVDEDPEQALAHARAARDRAARVAAVREAVGVAAYHAGDYAEAARELRAYRRMTGDESYRAVLADCERALGRPEVALRLVSEGLSASPGMEETAELRLVEAGARQDLGEPGAARLVLEDAMGGRPRPEGLDRADPVRLRLATAYAELLASQGDHVRAAEWFAVLAEADPAADVEFGEEIASGTDAAEGTVAEEAAAVEGETDPEDGIAQAPAGAGFEAEVEAEVAELLGEAGPADRPEDDQPEH